MRSDAQRGLERLHSVILNIFIGAVVISLHQVSQHSLVAKVSYNLGQREKKTTEEMF